MTAGEGDGTRGAHAGTARLARIVASRYFWLLVGTAVTGLGGWLVLAQPSEGPRVGGLALTPALYYLQWVVYGAVIVLIGIRLFQYRRTLTPRQDIGFVLVVTLLYTLGFMLYYTPFVREFHESPLTGVVRAGVMLLCGALGAVYGLSSTHRWH